LAAGLRDVAKGDGALASDERVEQWLPFAVAAGVGVGLVKRASREGRRLPAWFQAAGDHGADMTALVAMLSSTAASSGAHGAGGAGAAGGGSSGAS
jgi:hypothetical protein